MVKRQSFLYLYTRQFDYALLLLITAATALGLLVLDGSTHQVLGLETYTMRQAAWWGVGICAFMVGLLVPYGWLRYAGWPLYVLSIALLVLPLFMKGVILESIEAGGALSWIKIPGTNLRFQPSEFAKITVAMTLAHWLCIRQGKLRNIWECFIPTILVAIPVALIFKQPDFGGASVFIPILVVGLLVAGLDWRVIATVAAIGFVLAFSGIYYLMTADEIPGLKKYQQQRLQVFLGPIAQPFRPPGVEEVIYAQPGENKTEAKSQELSPESKKDSGDDWNIRQAEMALGSGQIFGKGWRKGTQSRMKFLPEHYTDFIFPSLGEQFGLVGCLTLLLLYLFIIWRCLRIAIASHDPFGKYLVMGLVSIFLTHIFLNVGMTIRLLPITGLPLPFMSYGGSFLATNYLLFGLIANVGMRRSKFEVRV